MTRARLSESQQAAEAQLAGIVGELAGMDAPSAEAHVIETDALTLLGELPLAHRATYGAELCQRAPGLSSEVEAAQRPASVAVSPSPRWQPFPTDVLPYEVARYVVEVSDAIGCDPSMVALPALACLAGAIGNRRAVRLKHGYVEPAIIWGAIVAPSGTRKTPALNEPTLPLRIAEAAAIERERERWSEYKADLQRWQDTPRAKRSGDRPPEPEPEARLIVSDITVEALTVRLSHSPAGLLLYRDELAGWVRSFNQYKGGSGGDAQSYLEMHRAGSLLVDRKSGGETLSVLRAAVSIIGSIQPEVLASVLQGEHTDNGLAARLLFVMPPVTPALWNNNEISEGLRGSWAYLLEGLRRLEANEDGPVEFALTPDALRLFQNFHDEYAERIANSDSEALGAAASKLQGCAARLALIVTLASDPLAMAVDVDGMTSGIELARWFGNETERVYASFHERPEDRERRRLVEYIAGRGGHITVRELRRGPRRYRPPGAAEAALDDLEHARFGEWVERAPESGGHAVREFVLLGDSDTGDGDTRPAFSPRDSGDTRPVESNNDAGLATVAAGDTRTEHEERVSPSPPEDEENVSRQQAQPMAGSDPDRFAGMDWREQQTARLKEIRERDGGSEGAI